MPPLQSYKQLLKYVFIVGLLVSALVIMFVADQQPIYTANQGMENPYKEYELAKDTFQTFYDPDLANISLTSSNERLNGSKFNSTSKKPIFHSPKTSYNSSNTTNIAGKHVAHINASYIDDDFKSPYKDEDFKSPYIDINFKVDDAAKYEAKHKILWWNRPHWMIGQWDYNVQMNQCTYKNCEVVVKKELFQQSSAVAFSVVDAGLGDKPPIPTHLRNPDQAWIFFTLESPINMPIKDAWSPHWHNSFNWSWTFRQDADIFHPYGALITKKIVPEKNYTLIYRKKKKLAAWLVSHCGTIVQRERYVKMMQTFAPDIDVFGSCGKATPANIEHIISSEYKFYLGFENSLCQDYITEKFFHYYMFDLITVVRGKIDYNKFLPNGTFINTADFASVKELVDFMQKLGSNEQEYIKYLKSKDRYEVQERTFLNNNALCEICHRVNNIDKYRKTYSNIKDWFGLCYTANDFKLT